MRKELEMKLAEEFAFLRRAETRQEGRIENLFQAFGYECGDGWYELLRGLCGQIVSAYEEAGQPVDIVIDQIKEKFGTLRFYYHFGGLLLQGHAILPLFGQEGNLYGPCHILLIRYGTDSGPFWGWVLCGSPRVTLPFAGRSRRSSPNGRTCPQRSAKSAADPGSCGKTVPGSGHFATAAAGTAERRVNDA